MDQGIKEIKFYNRKTKLRLPNMDWESGNDYDYDSDYEYAEEDDIVYDKEISEQELEDLFAEPPESASRCSVSFD